MGGIGARTGRLVAGVAMAALLAMGATGWASVARSGPAGDTPPRVEPRDCGAVPPGLDFEVTCAWLLVPEDRTDARSATIRLAVMTLHGRSATPRPDPVVFLAGGPGDPAIAGFERFQGNPMLADRDVILFDQRGAGLSEPSLDCPEREEAVIQDFGRALPHRRELHAVREAIVACRERLEREGVDLDAYDTKTNAADLADLRIALGIDEWNLNGISYGTRLALETMRSYPDGIRAAVLDSVYPPDRAGMEDYAIVDEAFDRLFGACADDVRCSSEHPDLARSFARALDRYDRDPASITLADGTHLEVTGSDVAAGLFIALYDRELIPLLPDAIETLAAGDIGPIRLFAEDGFTTLSDPSEGMFLSMECADLAQGARSKRNARVVADPGGKAVIVRYDAAPYCDVWDVEPLPASFSRPVRSRIPTLVMAGELDPITPAADSRRAAERLRNAEFVEFPGFGHTVTTTDCPRAIRQQFLDDPDAALDRSCVEALRLEFG